MKEKEGDDMAAIQLYMKAGLPAKAARLATSREVNANRGRIYLFCYSFTKPGFPISDLSPIKHLKPVIVIACIFAIIDLPHQYVGLELSFTNHTLEVQ